ncbi:SAV_2336 N-terminal domain-related protein [Streptomyces sp. NPDC052610]|uniref:SAV_2336 N-terminal domain-related protein n=1 Tax=Streptomyces sp. NPDC052610 TaxID=3154952 RepID=UPI003447020F
MRSDDPLTRLADALAGASPSGTRPTPRELAELLWLAGHMEPVPGEGESGADGGDRGADGGRPAPDGEESGPGGEAPQPHHERPEPPQEEPDPPHPQPEAPGTPPRAPLHLPSPTPDHHPGGPRHASLLAPAPPMLRHPLGLQRALRPLKRRTDAPAGRELDERATAERIARLGADPEWWLPVMRPARERWLRLHVVHDTGPTMPVWRPLISELHTALAQSGVFRTVTLHPAGPDGTVHGHAAHTPADGRTVILLVSDCMGPQWRKGPAADRWYATLRRWARRLPLALVQPLPEHLWRDTALPTTPGRLSVPHPAAPTASLRFTPYDAPEDGTEDGTDGTDAAAADTVPLPVLEPEPDWLANWAALIASTGGTDHPAAVARLGSAPPPPDDRTDLALLTPEELVLRFRGTASPDAFRLAGHVAVGRPDLPVMRLVQAALEPDPRPQHLAELILSGLLTTVPGPPGSYAFRPGVRDLLLLALPRTARSRTTDLLERVGGLIDTRAGRAPGEFLASTPAPGGTETGAEPEAFATVSQEALRQLTGGAVPVPPGVGGRYRPRRRLNPAGTLWQAEDTEANRTVALRLHGRITDPARRNAFLRDARRLARVRHRNVVAVHDFGIEDDVPYVVMEHLDGIALNSLAAPNGYRLPPPLFAAVGAQLAKALTAVHDAGLTHGGLGMSRVLLLPDGTAKLTLFEPGRTSGPAGRSEDLRALCEVLLQLASGTSRMPLPIKSGLGHLPSGLRPAYAQALNRLMSRSVPIQEAGRDQLTAPELPAAARAAYDQRFYHVLGPLSLELPHDEHELPSGVKAMLAMLLLKHGRTVTHDELRKGMWGPADEPKDAMAALGRTAGRLRTLLGPGAALATRPDGYALHTSADFVDLVECERLVAQADTQDPRRARDLYGQALALWRTAGPLANVPGPAAQTARTRLLQLRLSLHRTCAELDLDLGEVDRAATGLTELVRLHPAREDFRRLLLIALRRLGRLEEALDVFEEYELSGGRGPELLALGAELRDEFGGPPEEAPDTAYDESRYGDAPASPDELPAGSFPTEEDLPSLLAQDEDEPDAERPLPRDEVPESLFPEDRGEAAPGWVVFEFADGPQGMEAHRLLKDTITRWAAEIGWRPEHYPLIRRQADYSMPATPALLAVVRDGFPELLAALDGVRLFVTFQARPGTAWAGGEDLPRDPGPVAGLLRVESGLLGKEWGLPSAVAYVRPEGGPRRLPPVPVDLTERRTAVGLREAVWRVSDPAEAVRSAGRDVEAEVRRHLERPSLSPPKDAIPGYTVRWRVSLPHLLGAAEAVILAFDGTLTQLYTKATRSETVRELARLLAERRDPDDALAGRPLLPARRPLTPQGDSPHPLDLLRAFQERPYAGELHTLLRNAEGTALRTARPFAGAGRLVRELAGKDVKMAVVTDTSTSAAAAFLSRHGLLTLLRGGVHGRASADTRLPPDPSLLYGAAEHLRVPAAGCLVIGSTEAEEQAARAAGATFVRVDLSALLDAARDL